MHRLNAGAWPLVLVLLSLPQTGCASTARQNRADPIEPFNRGVYKFNDAVDRAPLKPAARVYRDHTPKWLQTGVGHFYTNLSYPWTIVNQVLQGKIVAAGQDTLRSAINTTLGWGGVLDVVRREPAATRRGPRPDARVVGRASRPIPDAAAARPVHAA